MLPNKIRKCAKLESKLNLPDAPAPSNLPTLYRPPTHTISNREVRFLPEVCCGFIFIVNANREKWRVRSTCEMYASVEPQMKNELWWQINADNFSGCVSSTDSNQGRNFHCSDIKKAGVMTCSYWSFSTKCPTRHQDHPQRESWGCQLATPHSWQPLMSATHPWS